MKRKKPLIALGFIVAFATFSALSLFKAKHHKHGKHVHKSHCEWVKDK